MAIDFFEQEALKILDRYNEVYHKDRPVKDTDRQDEFIWHLIGIRMVLNNISKFNRQDDRRKFMQKKVTILNELDEAEKQFGAQEAHKSEPEEHRVAN